MLGHCVRGLPAPVVGRGRRRAGARAPRYHPACRADARPLSSGCDGPTRSVLLGLGRSSEGSPVMAGSSPLLKILEVLPPRANPTTCLTYFERVAGGGASAS
ncbi:MAG: hypothetical protein F6Q13_09620, partial [Mycobacterium sp.]